MTFPQLFAVLNEFKEPVEKVTSGRDMLDWIRRVREGV